MIFGVAKSSTGVFFGTGKSWTEGFDTSGLFLGLGIAEQGDFTLKANFCGRGILNKEFYTEV